MENQFILSYSAFISSWPFDFG